jgi:hypothetical protein
MSRRGQQKAFLPASQLPPITELGDGTYGYVVRYRIASEDSNRFSHWSPVYLVRPNYIYERPEGKELDDFFIDVENDLVSVVWDPVAIRNNFNQEIVGQVKEYDVWVRWGEDDVGNWSLFETVEGNGARFIVPNFYTITINNQQIRINTKPTELSVEVYVRSSPPSRDSATLLVYKKYLVPVD